VRPQVLRHEDMVRVQCTLKDNLHVSLPHDMRHNITVSRLQATVSDMLEAKASGVPRRRLLGITDPENKVIEAKGLSLGKAHAHAPERLAPTAKTYP
jgi:hypothetical protein